MIDEAAPNVTAARVLVTGGSGFIAGHCVLQLLEQGFLVRTTVRSLAKEGTVRAVLANAGMVKDDNLSFVAADLTHDNGWNEAASGVDFVLHVASPVQPGHVENEDDLIVPAREGTLRVLRGGAGRVRETRGAHVGIPLRELGLSPRRSHVHRRGLDSCRRSRRRRLW